MTKLSTELSDRETLEEAWPEFEDDALRAELERHALALNPTPPPGPIEAPRGPVR